MLKFNARYEARVNAPRASSFIYSKLSSHAAALSTFDRVKLGWKLRNQRNICIAGWLSATLSRLLLFATTEVASVQLSTTRTRGREGGERRNSTTVYIWSCGFGPPSQAPVVLLSSTPSLPFFVLPPIKCCYNYVERNHLQIKII